MVKLTINHVPELMLFNNSRGIVRGILYADGHGYDPRSVPILMVDFPEYVGPALNEDMAAKGQGKWIPIAQVERRCDCRSCSRTGLPLAIGKCDSIHCTQGLTIGKKKSIKRLVLKWSIATERR